MCDVCSNIHNQIRRYHQCQEDGSRFVLSKFDVLANVVFPITWNQRQCLCCFKDTKNYEAYNNIVQMVIVTAIRLLQSINDDEKIVRGTDGGFDLEAQNDIEANEAVWTVMELEQLLNFISNSLLMSFPLYIICRHNHICGVEDLSNQESNILATYCDISDADLLPVMLLRNVCYFCDSGGPQTIKRCIEDHSSLVTSSMLLGMISSLNNLKLWLTNDAVDAYITPLKSTIVRYICGMSDSELRHAGSRSITEMVATLIKEQNSAKALSDTQYLKLSFKYFSCSTLTIRMAGLQQLNGQVALLNDINTSADDEMERAGALLSEWLVTNRIIEHIFGPNLHNELVKQSQTVLNFLGNEGKITCEHIDVMWTAAMMKHCARQVLDALLLLVKHLNLQPLVHLMDLLAALDTNTHTEQTLLLVSTITKVFWTIRTREDKFRSAKQCPSVYGAMEVVMAHDNEISVCSTDDEESDETSSSDYELQRPKRALPDSADRLPIMGVAENPVESILERGPVRFLQSLASAGNAVSVEPTDPPVNYLASLPPGVSVVINNSKQVPIAKLPTSILSQQIPGVPLPITLKELQKAMPNQLSRSPASSPLGSVKSEKNMADFEGEEFVSDEELIKIHELHTQKTVTGPHSPRSSVHNSPKSTSSSPASTARALLHAASSQWTTSSDALDSANVKYLDLDHVCEAGRTLLWDLIQDELAPRLPDGLACEAEKLLSSLLCASDVSVKIKLSFIKACISNISANKSSTVSLRLLPKLISSFHHPFQRSQREIHETTLFVEETLHMMEVFFSNLKHFRSILDSTDMPYSSLHGLEMDIRVRLHFLTFIYSYTASPEDFCLSQQQIDCLWSCLAMNADTCDFIFNWLFIQVKARECHALSRTTFMYIYTDKLTQLNLRELTMTGFQLFHLLHDMLSQADRQVKGQDTQLWEVALKSKCTDVSKEAIDYLNNCYMMDSSLGRENEFIDRCMKCVQTAVSNMQSDCETSLQVVQRGLYLLKHHIDNFKQKYAYQLKMMQLKGAGCVSHQMPAEEKGTQLLKITLSAPVPKCVKNQDTSYKVVMEVMSSTLLGEFRAEVTNWWNKLMYQQGANTSETQREIPHIRLIANGLELSPEMDRKSLGELDLKADQTVLVSIGSSRQKMKQDNPVLETSVPSHLIPMNILVQEPYFTQLFNILQVLNNLEQTLPSSQENRHGICSRARVLARRVWYLLMAVPTNPNILKSLSEPSSQEDWATLLNPSEPSRLIYALQVIEVLSKENSRNKSSLTISSGGDVKTYFLTGSGDHNPVQTSDKHQAWSRQFITNGGLAHLFEILAQKKLQQAATVQSMEWEQEALAYLLKLMSQLAVLPLSPPSDSSAASVAESSNMDRESDSNSNSNSNSNPFLSKKAMTAKNVVPSLNEVMLELLKYNYEEIFNILYNIVYRIVSPATNQTSVWSRTEVLHYSMVFLVFWAYSDDKIQYSLNTAENPPLSEWLKSLTLKVPESQLRQEACRSLYKLCLGQSSSSASTNAYLRITLSALLTLLPSAACMNPLMSEVQELAESRKCKLGVSSQDYLWLTTQLLDILDLRLYEELELNDLAEKLKHYIANRKYYEQRHSTAEDEGLIGLLSLLTVVVKRSPEYKFSAQAKELLVEIFEDLFSLPCIEKRYLPKCKSNSSRCAAYDLLVELVKGSAQNYKALHEMLIKQHDRDASYQWDYWPNDDVRSVSGYVGLQNLGATCYMATCMQHLYMLPLAREAILQAKLEDVKTGNSEVLKEIQRMFAFLMESERKSYQPESYCKVYEMDHQPLNTGEQKDMTEFFTDLITKLEDMSPHLATMVKSLFGGVISNNVVSLDCAHVSRTLEEFYTVRCQVADMKTLYESLDEICVKDTLDGDNMYTCSQCQTKVRAEKRACFKKLPRILCLNTMRYSFNMVTMLKEKINTHFSFPHQLSMSEYMEDHLLKLGDKNKVAGSESSAGATDTTTDTDSEQESTDYELIGVTVHTGTADGGHYYSFIRERTGCEPGQPDKWFLFNDSEVKPFDPAQIAQECFGGEMTSTTYDTITDKFMDFSFEKTNSAYMLFYERVTKDPPVQTNTSAASNMSSVSTEKSSYNFELSPDLAEWIWKDNTTFLQDKNIFCHNYFGFMWQMCAFIPTTLPEDDQSVKVLPAQLSSCFLLETFIHSKEKPTMVQWMELLTKQFNQCHRACEWLLEKMSLDDHWSKQILINCSNQTIRQMFLRLLIHVITQLRNEALGHLSTPLKVSTPSDHHRENRWLSEHCVVGRFILKQLQLLQHPDICLSNCKCLSEFFAFLYEFAKLGAEEKEFLRGHQAISIMATFYMGNQDRPSSTSSQGNGAEAEDEDDSLTALAEERSKITSLEKMIHLIAMLVEGSRHDKELKLSSEDADLLLGDKGMRFLMNQIKDGLNLRQSCNLIYSLCHLNSELAANVVNSLLQNILKTNNKIYCQTYLKMLTMLTELPHSTSGPSFTELILSKFWVVCDRKPTQFLEWMSNLVCHNSIAHSWVLERLNEWVESYLLACTVQKVRTWAMFLLAMLVPSQAFRIYARAGGHATKKPNIDLKSQMTPEAISVLHTIYNYLLDLLPTAKTYADRPAYGTTHLVSYFNFLTFCLISKQEKLMFLPRFQHLWQMFQPKMTDPQISMNHNKQALLLFWYNVSIDCPEIVAYITDNPTVTKNIAFNYILADHDDQEVVSYNRCMLPAYYGLLRLCCQQSRYFTRVLSQHQNLLWAFQHIAPFPHLYPTAVEELLAMLSIIVTQTTDSSKEDIQAIAAFKKKLLSTYQQTLNPRSDWQTIINVLKIALVSDEDRLMYIGMSGLTSLTEAFSIIHSMYHEATACHVLTDLCDCLSLLVSLLKVASEQLDESSEKKAKLSEGTESNISLYTVLNSGDRQLLSKYCLTLLNSYSPYEVRNLSLEVLRKLVMMYPENVIPTLATQLLAQHTEFQGLEAPHTNRVLAGPYLPSRNKPLHTARISIRPPQPQFGMFMHHNIIEITRGQDTSYDQAMNEFYHPYHIFIDLMVRMAVNRKCLTEDLVNLSALVAYEGIPLQFAYFAKLWCEIIQAEKSDKSHIQQLCSSNYLIDYMESILHDNRSCLTNQHVYQFFTYYFKLVHQSVLCDESTVEGVSLTSNIVQALHKIVTLSNRKVLGHVIAKANGDLRALNLILQVQPPTEYDVLTVKALNTLKARCQEYKESLQKTLTETIQMLPTPASSTQAGSDKDKLMSSPPAKKSAEPDTDDQQVPSKKLKLEESHEEETTAEARDESVRIDQPKVTIEYKPAEEVNRAKKGCSQSAASKGKAPVKKTLLNLCAGQESKTSAESQQLHKLVIGSIITGRSSPATVTSDSQNAKATSAPHIKVNVTSTADLHSSGSSSNNTTSSSPASAGNVDMLTRIKKKLEMINSVIEMADSLLAMFDKFSSETQPPANSVSV